MAQLRLDYPKFKALNTEVMVMLPNLPRAITRYVRDNQPPYLILSDPASKVAAQYFQIRKFFLAGTPSVFLVNQSGQICYASYIESLRIAPDNQELLEVAALAGG